MVGCLVYYDVADAKVLAGKDMTYPRGKSTAC